MGKQVLNHSCQRNSSYLRSANGDRSDDDGWTTLWPESIFQRATKNYPNWPRATDEFRPGTIVQEFRMKMAIWGESVPGNNIQFVMVTVERLVYWGGQTAHPYNFRDLKGKRAVYVANSGGAFVLLVQEFIDFFAML